MKSVLLVAAMVLLSVQLCAAFYDPCNYYTSCLTCANDTKCGWCESGIGVCLSKQGTASTGAIGCTTLNGGNTGAYIQNTAQCLATFPNCTSKYPDNSNTTCNNCIADAACGWCFSPGLGGTCRGNGFAYGCGLALGTFLQNPSNTTTCPVDDSPTCRAHLSCSLCEADSLCGWCQAPSSDRNCFALSGNASQAGAVCENSLTGFAGRWYGTTSCPSYPTCPGNSRQPAGAVLTTCSSYSNIACCNAQEDTNVQGLVDALASNLTSQCTGYLRSMLCATLCSPDAGNSTLSGSGQLYLQTGFAEDFYCNCIAKGSLANFFQSSDAFFGNLTSNVAVRGLTYHAGNIGYTASLPSCTTGMPTSSMETSSASALVAGLLVGVLAMLAL